jgi:hypothetical protein
MIDAIRDQWHGIVVGFLLAMLVIGAVLWGDLRPLSSERRWSKLHRQQRRDVDRLAKKGTP